jgi:RNA polymerase sigma-B factor
VRNFSAKYESEHGVKPSVKLIAEKMNLSEEDVVKAMEVGGTYSLDSMAGNEEEGDKSLYALIADSEDKYDEFETKETLKAAMRDFSDTEKQLIKLRYMDELSQSETARQLGVSQMTVSRVERDLLKRLKARLKDSI